MMTDKDLPEAQVIGVDRNNGAKYGNHGNGVYVNGKVQNDHLTSEQKWGLVYSCVMAYYTFDAVFSLILALLGMIASLVGIAINGSSCGLSTIASTLIFLTRIYDACHGCCTLCFSKGVPGHKKFREIVRRNIALTIFQAILALAQIGIGSYLLLTDDIVSNNDDDTDDSCAVSGIIAIGFGGLLVMNCAEEAFVWFTVYVATKFADSRPVPDWVDKFIPSCLKKYATTGRLC